MSLPILLTVLFCSLLTITSRVVGCAVVIWSWGTSNARHTYCTMWGRSISASMTLIAIWTSRHGISLMIKKKKKKSNLSKMWLNISYTECPPDMKCTCTVKPALVTTCLQRPPVCNKHIFCFPWKWFLIETCSKGTCLRRPIFVFPLGGCCRQVWLYIT